MRRKAWNRVTHPCAENKNEAGRLIIHCANSQGEGARKSREAQQAAPRQQTIGRVSTHVAHDIRRTRGLSAGIELETTYRAHRATRCISVRCGRRDCRNLCAKISTSDRAPEAPARGLHGPRRGSTPPRTICVNAAFICMMFARASIRYTNSGLYGFGGPLLH